MEAKIQKWIFNVLKRAFWKEWSLKALLLFNLFIFLHFAGKTCSHLPVVKNDLYAEHFQTLVSFFSIISTMTLKRPICGTTYKRRYTVVFKAYVFGWNFLIITKYESVALLCAVIVAVCGTSSGWDPEKRWNQSLLRRDRSCCLLDLCLSNNLRQSGASMCLSSS